MKIMIVGLGSMGKRRLRLIKKLMPEAEIFGIDGREDRRQEVADMYDVEVFDSLDSGIKRAPEIAFVCAAPLAHHAIIKKCLNAGISVFSEINLVNEGHKELIMLAKDKGCTLFLSSTPIYRKEIEYITEEISRIDAPVNYIYHVGQYLPDWHPWESFNDFFIGDKRTNGCREIFAIELPWIINAFGPIKNYYSIHNKISDLNIDFDDSYLVSVEHEDGTIGSLCFDVVSRPAVRRLDVFGNHFKLDWGGTPDTLFSYDESGKPVKISLYEEVEQDSNYNSSIVENMYAAEIESFFDVFAGKESANHSFEKDIENLKLIDQIEGI